MKNRNIIGIIVGIAVAISVAIGISSLSSDQQSEDFIHPPKYLLESPTSDGGKECTDSSQCESYCQAKEGAEVGSHVTGMCYAFKEATCMEEVIDGIYVGIWCS